MLRSFMSLLGAITGGHDHDFHDDHYDLPDDHYDPHDHDIEPDYNANLLNPHPQVEQSFGHSPNTGTYDPDSETATFPDGDVVEKPYQDAQGQVYKTREDWVNGQDPYTIEEA